MKLIDSIIGFIVQLSLVILLIGFTIPFTFMSIQMIVITWYSMCEILMEATK